MGRIDNFADWSARHWGDCIGILLLLLGGSLIILYAAKTGDWNEVKTLGVGLASAALIVLKLRTNPKNGNGQSKSS